MSRKKNILILGFALFSMFFGAGNLIIPPSLGKSVGDFWGMASVGFFITGIGLPLLGILTFTKIGNIDHFADNISSKFNTFYLSLLILVIGPLCAIPRTGSVTFEMGILPFFNTLTKSEFYMLSIVTSIIFFGVTLFLVLNESKVLDILGKFLTPVILIMLAILIVMGVKISISENLNVHVENLTSITSFSKGFIQGYQTMDALGSVLMGVIIIKSLKEKGITEEKEQGKYLIFSGIIAALGLGIVYISLIYLGSTFPQLQSSQLNLSTAQVTLYIAQIILGKFGKIAIGICVAAACLTTSVGLVALASDWFSKLLNISYRKMATLICWVSGVLSIIGLDSILKLSVPILLVLYPITIVLMLLNIFGAKKIVFKITVYTTCVVSVLLTLAQYLNINLSLFSVPQDFMWIFPVLTVFIITTLIRKDADE